MPQLRSTRVPPAAPSGSPAANTQASTVCVKRGFCRRAAVSFCSKPSAISMTAKAAPLDAAWETRVKCKLRSSSRLQRYVEGSPRSPKSRAGHSPASTKHNDSNIQIGTEAVEQLQIGVSADFLNPGQCNVSWLRGFRESHQTGNIFLLDAAQCVRNPHTRFFLVAQSCLHDSPPFKEPSSDCEQLSRPTKGAL